MADLETALVVKHSGFVDFSSFEADGALLVSVEASKSLPFEIKRVFYITNLHPGLVRGKHAHRTCEQAIVCIKGSFELILDDGENTQSLTLSNPTKGVLLGAGLWHEMRNFSEDCVIVVFADAHYNESEVIRTYEEFQTFAAA